MKYRDIFKIADDKSKEFGVYAKQGWKTKKPQTATRIMLVKRFALILACLESIADKKCFEMPKTKDELNLSTLQNRLKTFYYEPLKENGYDLYAMMKSLFDRANQMQVSNETLLAEISQIVLYANLDSSVYLKVYTFFFRDETINLKSVILAFNKETMDIKKAKRDRACKKMTQYQKANMTKILAYRKERYKDSKAQLKKAKK